MLTVNVSKFVKWKVEPWVDDGGGYVAEQWSVGHLSIVVDKNVDNNIWLMFALMLDL